MDLHQFAATQVGNRKPGGRPESRDTDETAEDQL